MSEASRSALESSKNWCRPSGELEFMISHSGEPLLEGLALDLLSGIQPLQSGINPLPGKIVFVHEKRKEAFVLRRLLSQVEIRL